MLFQVVLSAKNRDINFKVGKYCFRRAVLFFLLQHLKLHIAIHLQMLIESYRQQGLIDSEILEKVAKDTNLHLDVIYLIGNLS
jgi:hypothetical protein